MRLLLIHHVGDIYGASKSLLRLSSGLVRDGHSVMVIIPEDGPLCPALEKSGVTVTCMPSLPVMHRSRLTSLSGLFKLLCDARKFRRALKKVINEFHPDIIHTNTGAILPIAGMIARSMNIPHVQHMRESFLDFGYLWPPYRWWLYRNASHVVCISSFIASMFTPAQQRGRIRVIHNGIPREEFERIDGNKVTEFRRKCGPPGPLIGIAGRIKLVRKGQDVFVKAAGLIKDQFPDAQFAVVGSPFPGNESHLDTLRILVRDLNMESRVHFIGHTDEPLVAMAAFDISVMASTSPEPLGNVTIESMALGRPVIGTDVGGTAELIENGKTGLLVPPGDPQAMASAMTHLLSHPEKAAGMGQMARQHYLEHFEFASFYEAMKHLYGIAST